MGDPRARRLATIRYALLDVQSALKSAARPASALEIGIAAESYGTLDALEFLHQSRLALESVLLDERDLPTDLIGLVLETIAAVDDLLAGGEKAPGQQDAERPPP